MAASKPETVAPKKAKAPLSVEEIYNAFWEANPIEGETPTVWSELVNWAQENYEQAVAHVRIGQEPRTEFEKFVKSVA